MSAGLKDLGSTATTDVLSFEQTFRGSVLHT